MWKLYLICLVFIFSCTSSSASCFTFDNDLQGWGVWGEGEGQYVKTLGRNAPGSVMLSNMGSGQITLNKKFLLKKGRYRVTAWIRGLDIQVGRYGNSFLLFYSVARKTIFPSKTVHGTFEWSRISYTIDGDGGWSNIWFRLASQGTVWIDDICIEPYKGDVIAFQFDISSNSFPVPEKVGTGIRCPNCYRWTKKSSVCCPVCGEKLAGKKPGNSRETTAPSRLTLIDFEKGAEKIEERRHHIRSYCETLFTSGKRSGRIQYGKYNELRMNEKIMRDWSQYDYFCLDIFNPLHRQCKFAMAIRDRNGGGYWNQLNHYSTLAPGWNKLRFQLNRYVGERGSVRIKRYLDKSDIKGVWFGIEPESPHRKSDLFVVDNIRLEKAPPSPESFDGLLAFDFVKDRKKTQPGFIGITMAQLYHRDIGFGFEKSRFWRAHDSIYADTLCRDGIFINEGVFRVDLPNGRYRVNLVYEGLGEWYEHFWTYRKITIQNKVVLVEKRNDVADYLADYLRFQDLEPGPEDNVFDLYISKIFRPLEYEVEVKNNRLEFSFSGDDSAVMLNSLVIFPVDKEKKGEEFLRRLRRVRRDEYDNITRRLYPQAFEEKGAIGKEDYKRGFYAALIDENIQLRCNHIYKSEGKRIKLRGGRLQRPVQAIMVRNLGEGGNLKISFSSLRSEGGAVIKAEKNWLRYGVNQYQSHTYNHETYELAPRFLRRFPATGKYLQPLYSLLLWYQIPIDVEAVPGIYRGSVVVELNGRQIKYPVELEVFDFTLPKVDIAAGFFGLDPFTVKYFKGRGVEDLLEKNRFLMLEELSQRGFSTWSSLPQAEFFEKNGDLYLQAAGVDALMKKARQLGFSRPVFTYGGSFPVDPDGYAGGREPDREKYLLRTAAVLRQHMSREKWLPVIFSITDEAWGYSQRIDRDKKRAEMLKKHFPYLRRGGFSRPLKEGEPGADLNLLLTDISLSSITGDYIHILQKNGIRWGLYNQAIGLFENNRPSFGVNLFTAKKKGADHFLEWSLALAQNYPYFDLDGRENDAMMVFPRKDGDFDYGLKFEWATLGLEDYRLLQLAGEDSLEERGQRDWDLFREKLYRKILQK